MAERVETVAQRRFTVEEYHRMAEAGILAANERVELLRGVVRTVSPNKRSHVIITRRVFDFFVSELFGRASVYKEDPLSFPELLSEAGPDVWIGSSPDVESYGTEATVPLLVVEVAEGSRQRDLGEKASLYAAAGIPEYWVVDLVDRSIVVFRSPDGVYRKRASYGVGATVSPQAFPDLELDVGALLGS